jgi:hypothetical protein
LNIDKNKNKLISLEIFLPYSPHEEKPFSRAA